MPGGHVVIPPPSGVAARSCLTVWRCFFFPFPRAHTNPHGQLCSPACLVEGTAGGGREFSAFFSSTSEPFCLLVCLFLYNPPNETCPALHLTLSNRHNARSLYMKLAGKVRHSAGRWRFSSCQRRHWKSNTFTSSFSEVACEKCPQNLCDSSLKWNRAVNYNIFFFF